MYKHCFLPLLLDFVMKMHCTLPHNPYCCSLPLPMCMPCLSIHTSTLPHCLTTIICVTWISMVYMCYYFVFSFLWFDFTDFTWCLFALLWDLFCWVEEHTQTTMQVMQCKWVKQVTMEIMKWSIKPQPSHDITLTKQMHVAEGNFFLSTQIMKKNNSWTLTFMEYQLHVGHTGHIQDCSTGVCNLWPASQSGLGAEVLWPVERSRF